MEEKNVRARQWMIIVYPESAPEDWRQILDDLQVQWVESPLHDRDLKEDGTPKKPHWHVMLHYEGKKSYSQVKLIAEMLHAPIPQKVESARVTVRYFAHMDHPQKAQYDPSGIVGHGGLEPLTWISAQDEGAKVKAVMEMMAFCSDNCIDEFYILAELAMAHRPDWLPVLMGREGRFLDSYLRSKRCYQERNRPEE